MSETQKGMSTPTQNQFVDSLDSDIEESLRDPQYRAAYEDTCDRYALIDRLVQMRKDRNLTQKQVADRMGVGQSTIAGFENEGSDPRLSTIQRYARAVERRCVVDLQTPIECDWVSSPASYTFTVKTLTRSTSVHAEPASETTNAWLAAANAKRSSFALAS